MKPYEFRRTLERMVPLVVSYAVDSLNVPQTATPDTLSKYIEPADFVRKVHDGFKLAQPQLVEIILSIEDEMRQVDHLKRQSKRLRTKLQRENDLRELKTKVAVLRWQRSAFQEVANVIAWTLFGMERTHIKAMMKKGMGHGYLRDRNIDSVVMCAKQINSDPDSFALITDITSCLGIGDLILFRLNQPLAIVEVKEGRISEWIGETLRKGQSADVKKLLDGLLQLNVSPDKIMNQMARNVRQLETAHGATEYIRTDRTDKDFLTGLPRYAVEPRSQRKYLWGEVNAEIQKVKEEGWRGGFVNGDCLTVGIIRPFPKESAFVSRMDFRHYVYHTTKVPFRNCQYVTDVSKNATPEFFDYRDLPIYSLKEKVFIPSHFPLFAMLDTESSIDLLTDALRIYVHFDVDVFWNICEHFRISPHWISVKEYQQTFGKRLPRIFHSPLFPKGYLGFKGHGVFMHGLLWSLVYELETGASIANQLQAEPERHRS